ncbi:MAG: OmpA family protein [Rikenellaceae bacterium]
MRNFLLLLLAVPLIVMGQKVELQPNEELQLIDKLHYDRDHFIAPSEELAKLNELVWQMRKDTTIDIHVIGYCDKWGGVEVNDRFSYLRAKTIADWMVSCRVPRKQIVYIGCGIDTLAANDTQARRVEVLKVTEKGLESVVEIVEAQSTPVMLSEQSEVETSPSPEPVIADSDPQSQPTQPVIADPDPQSQPTEKAEDEILN